MPDANDRADILIVGGGSAGAVLAARLTEDSARTVLLLEAGPAYVCVPKTHPPRSGGESVLVHEAAQ